MYMLYIYTHYIYIFICYTYIYIHIIYIYTLCIYIYICIYIDTYILYTILLCHNYVSEFPTFFFAEGYPRPGPCHSLHSTRSTSRSRSWRWPRRRADLGAPGWVPDPWVFFPWGIPMKWMVYKEISIKMDGFC